MQRTALDEALDKTTSPQRLFKLAETNDEKICMTVAANPNTSKITGMGE